MAEEYLLGTVLLLWKGWANFYSMLQCLIEIWLGGWGGGGVRKTRAITCTPKRTLIGNNICFKMSFLMEGLTNPMGKGLGDTCMCAHIQKNHSLSIHLKCSEPFLETRGWLDGVDTPSRLPLTVGCSDLAKRGRCGRAWDDPRWAARNGEE